MELIENGMANGKGDSYICRHRSCGADKPVWWRRWWRGWCLVTIIIVFHELKIEVMTK